MEKLLFGVNNRGFQMTQKDEIVRQPLTFLFLVWVLE